MTREELESALLRLEDIMIQVNAAIVPLFAPGVEEGKVTEDLEGIGLIPTSELIAWFAWHNGAGQPGVPSTSIELVPGAEFYDLRSLVRECLDARRVAAELAGRPGYPFGADELWQPTWFPLLRLFGKGLLVAEAPGRAVDVSPIHLVWFDSEPTARARLAWPTMAAFVGTVISRFEEGIYSVNKDGMIEGPTIEADN